MSKPLRQSNAVLIIAAMYNNKESFEYALKALKKHFGNIFTTSDEFIFSHSHYYKEEMGENLIKRFIVFETPIKREFLVNVKKKTDKIEKKLLSKNGERSINLDPGILTLENFILATNKNFTHRILLGKSVFADLTLIYQKKKGFTSLPWTYADYSSDETKMFLESMRKSFYNKLLETSPFNGKK